MFTLAISPSFAILQIMALFYSMSTARSAPGRKHFVKYFVAKRIANEVNLPFDPAKENYPARDFVEGTVRYALGGVLTVDLTSPGIKDPVSRELRPVKYILDGKYDESQIFEGYHYRLSDLKVGDCVCLHYVLDKKTDLYYYTSIKIVRRPGGLVPPSPSKPRDGWVPYDVTRNMLNRLEDGERVPEAELRSIGMKLTADKIYPKPDLKATPAKSDEKRQADPMKK